LPENAYVPVKTISSHGNNFLKLLLISELLYYRKIEGDVPKSVNSVRNGMPVANNRQSERREALNVNNPVQAKRSSGSSTDAMHCVYTINSAGVELLRSSVIFDDLPRAALRLQGVIQIEVLRTFCYASVVSSFLDASVCGVFFILREKIR
jgi:hypothetical protein